MVVYPAGSYNRRSLAPHVMIQNFRTQARRHAVQALYQWQISGQSPTEIVAQFRAGLGHDDQDWLAIQQTHLKLLRNFFEELMPGAVEQMLRREWRQSQRPEAELGPARQQLKQQLRTYWDALVIPLQQLTYFEELVAQTAVHQATLDAAFQPYLKRKHKALEDGQGIDPVEQAILRLATYELMFRPDVPYRAVINEAVELARLFASEQSHTFINGVLDKVAVQLRPEEVATPPTRRAAPRAVLRDAEA